MKANSLLILIPLWRVMPSIWETACENLYLFLFFTEITKQLKQEIINSQVIQ